MFFTVVFSALLSLVAASALDGESGLISKALAKRQGLYYLTCEQTYGAGYETCVSTPHCYNPGEGDTCCSDGRRCLPGPPCRGCVPFNGSPASSPPPPSNTPAPTTPTSTIPSPAATTPPPAKTCIVAGDYLCPDGSGCCPQGSFCYRDTSNQGKCYSETFYYYYYYYSYSYSFGVRYFYTTYTYTLNSQTVVAFTTPPPPATPPPTSLTVASPINTNLPPTTPAAAPTLTTPTTSPPLTTPTFTAPTFTPSSIVVPTISIPTFSAPSRSAASTTAVQQSSDARKEVAQIVFGFLISAVAAAGMVLL